MAIDRATRGAHAPPRASQPLCEVAWLGRVPYARGLEMQRQAVASRRANRTADRLLLLEHPHVITLGRNSHPENVLVDRDRLAALGVEIHPAGRGGDVTYHGPGQLVAYPILDLRPDRCDLHRYVRDLEQVLIRVLGEYGLAGFTIAGRTGVWVEAADGAPAKIAAIGVRVERWITSHGIALNVDPELRYFDLIVPCGLRNCAVTSLARQCGTAPALEDVAHRFAHHFGAVFERRMRDGLAT